MRYLGDFRAEQTVQFLWSTYDGLGASVTRGTDGTISVYKDNGTTQTTTGVTDTEDFDSLTGIHAVTIETTDAFYATGSDYSVVLSAATIDGQVVNAVLAEFSIENRGVASVSTGGITALSIAEDAIGASELAGDAATEIAAAVMAQAVESGLTLTNALRLIAAATAGKLSGAGSGTEVFRNPVADSKDRITATVDGDGNRTAITTDLT